MEPSCYLPSILCMETWLASGRLRETHRERKVWLTAPRNGQINPLQGTRPLGMQNFHAKKISCVCGRIVSVYEPDKGNKNDKMKVQLFYIFTGQNEGVK